MRILPSSSSARRLTTLATCLTVVLCGINVSTTAALAATTSERGLLITPLRQQIRLDAGNQKTSSFVVANLTKKTMIITLSVQEFSVEDYSYTYRFSKPHTDWVKLGITQLELPAGKSKTIPFSVNTAPTALPGGYYYALVASSKLSNNGIDTTVQAATLLYLTVNGNFTTSGEIADASINRVIFGKEVPYSLNATNTGNIYYFAYIAGKIHGLMGATQSQPTAHLLLPNKIRHVTGSIPTPFWPGVYQAQFGYYTDAGSTNVTTSRWIVVLPPWFIALVLAVILFNRQIKHAITVLRGRLRRPASRPDEP